MLTHLHINNFKSWRDTGDIRLAPLTVFFGSNSSGKSSINQFLLMLKQTAQSPDRKRVLHPGDEKTAIDLGTYKDIIYMHEESERISFKLRWNLTLERKIKNVLHPGSFRGKDICFNTEIGLSGDTKKALVVHKMSYTLGNLSKDGLKVVMNRKEAAKDKYELKAEGYNLMRKQGRGWPLPPPIRFYGFPDEVTAHYQNADFVQDFALDLENCLKNIYYLGPLREHPWRSYTWSGEIPEHVGWVGERAVDAILAASDRKINKGKGTTYREFKTIIAHWLKEMGLIESFEVKGIAPERRDYEVLVKTFGMKEKVNITDVGFGVSQVLPVIVQCFYSPADSTIIMEQPEIHLHPSVQASLADLFIETINAREDGATRNIQLLIESHSEHFLRRLQRRIAESKVAPKDVAIYFCQADPEGSNIKSLDVNLLGNILNWPENFFGDEIGDLIAMTKAAIQPKRRGSEYEK